MVLFWNVLVVVVYFSVILSEKTHINHVDLDIFNKVTFTSYGTIAYMQINAVQRPQNAPDLLVLVIKLLLDFDVIIQEPTFYMNGYN